MMRKIHRVALASALPIAVPALSVAFVPASVAWSKAFATERRFTWTAKYSAGAAYLLFEPSATASDNYFTVDIAWLRDGVATNAGELGDELTIPLLAPWQSMTRDQLLARPMFRLRLDDLWPDSPSQYRGSFSFSTAASRYTEGMFAASGGPSETREERALRLLQQCLADEKALTDSAASAEVAPAVELALLAVRDAALPAFESANRLAAKPSEA